MTILARGCQMPRVWSAPEYASTTGEEAVDLARLAGLALDPWQEFVLEHSLGEKPDGKWASPEVGLCVPRQNGKGALLEARQLAGLFLLGEELQIHSAHEYATSMDAYRRLKERIQDTPELHRRVKDRGGYKGSHGEEGIELRTGQRIWFRTRTKGGGRGFSSDSLYLDEAMDVPQASLAALMPTLSTRPNPQVWYTGSAVDQMTMSEGVVFARIRERGHRGDPTLAYFEWSIDCEGPDDLPDDVMVDREAWAAANPGLGIRIPEDWVETELGMGRRDFAVERLGIGDWPRTDGLTDTKVDLDDWGALIDGQSAAVDPVCFVFDVAPDRAWASIASVSRRKDGVFHCELVERKHGTGWLAGRLADLVAKWSPTGVFATASGPVSSLLRELEPTKVPVTTVSITEHAQACGLFVDTVVRKGLRHLGSPEVASAIRGAATRPVDDAWVWSRRHSNGDITPLVCFTIGVWAAAKHTPKYRAAGF